MKLDNVTYHEADEIDHVTLRHRQGKGLDRAKAIKMIRYYTWREEQVRALNWTPDPIRGDLSGLSDQELVDRLVAIRTYLLLKVFPESTLLREQEADLK